MQHEPTCLKIEMANLIIPSSVDVPGIVLDMIPTVAPNAEPREIEHSVLLTHKLIMLCTIAQANSTAEKIYSEVMQGMLGIRKF